MLHCAKDMLYFSSGNLCVLHLTGNTSKFSGKVEKLNIKKNKSQNKEQNKLVFRATICSLFETVILSKQSSVIFHCKCKLM